MQNYLLYQATKSIHQINECRYALLKYLSLYNLKTPNTTSVVIYSDKPAMFEAFTPFFEHFEMKPLIAASNFEMIHKVLDENEGNFLFCDTDTYPVKPLEILFKDLEEGKVYLFEDDGKEESLIRNQVIGLNTNNKSFLEHLRSEARSQNISQFDLKLPQIKNAELFFSHYNQLPEFKNLLHSFFKKNEEESVPNLIKGAQYFDAQQMQKDKEHYYTLPFYKKWLKNITGTRWSIKQYEKKF